MGKNNIRLGAIYMFISVTGFAVMDLAVKWTTEDYSIGYVVFWRMLGGLIPLIFTIPKDRWAHLLSTSKPGWHLTRAFAGTTALFFVYASLHYLQLATTVSLTLHLQYLALCYQFLFLEKLLRDGAGLLSLLDLLGY